METYGAEMDNESRYRLRETKYRIFFLIATWLIFLAGFSLGLAYPSMWTTLLHLLPVISAALMWGWKMGVIVALALIPSNVGMRLIFYPSTLGAMITADKIFAWVILLAVGASLGYLRDTAVRSRKAVQDLENSNARLHRALSEIKELTGLLPICASCKSIRNDSGYWQQVEVYLSSHADVQFSHSICPDCEAKLYGHSHQEE